MTADSIAAVKRQLSAAAAAIAVLAAGALASACTVTPSAASVNGDTISTASLNTRMHTMEETVAGGCLLQLQSNLASIPLTGDGGSGTYTMKFANAVLNTQVGNALAEQYATSLGITVSTADLTTAASDYQTTLDGEISQEASTASSEGVVTDCQLANGSNLTGKQLMAALPVSLRDAEVRNQAFDEKLLARGADLSAQAISAFYKANTGYFTEVCVSAIAVASQAAANQLVTQLNGGASFADLAKANSLDTQTASNGGSLGCNFSLSGVEQSLQVQNITVGQPIPPIQNTSSGAWYVYEVTNAAVQPLSSSTAVIKQELLRGTTNVNRVSKEIVGFARHADVSVNPQYGTWKGLTVIPPVAPPTQFLLAAAGGTSSSSGTSVLPTGSTGSAATGLGTTSSG